MCNKLSVIFSVILLSINVIGEYSDAANSTDAVDINASQKTVIEFEEIFLSSYRAIPDANNKLLVSDDYFDKPQSGGLLTDINVFPNWPIELQGPSQRGGIFANLDDDPELEIIYNVRQNVQAWNVDGSNVAGWPQLVSNGNCFLYSAPSFGDINGDGEGDVVVSTSFPGTGISGWLFAFNKDGTSINGFPFALPNGGGTYGPVLADLNDDGVLEIIVEERGNYPTGFLGVYNGDGTVFPGFPKELDHVPASAPAVGDINGDGVPEIVAESYISVFVYDVSGNLLPGFPFTLGDGSDRALSYSTPVLADLTGDGHREIIFGDHALTTSNGAMHILKSDGTSLAGWPKYTTNWIYAPPAVADIDGDGELDIAIGDKILSMSPSSKVYVWDKDGNPLPGWPSPLVEAINTQIIIANLDEDDDLEMIWDDNSPAGRYICYNHDGTPITGDWPLVGQQGYTSHFNNPFVADVDMDGFLDISGAMYNENYYCKFYLWYTDVPYDSSRAILPVLQYNVQHTGVYTPQPTTNVDETDIIPNSISLSQNYPNPFNASTTIKYSLSEPTDVEIKIYNLLGRLTEEIKVSDEQAGEHQIIWNADDCPSGVYFYNIQAGDYSETKKMVLLK